jgi:hypothetical protein
MKMNVLKDLEFAMVNNTEYSEQFQINGQEFTVSPKSKLTPSDKVPLVAGIGIPFSIQIEGVSTPLFLRFDVDQNCLLYNTTVIALNGWWLNDAMGENELQFLYVNEELQTIHRFTVPAIGILIVGTTDLPDFTFRKK